MAKVRKASKANAEKKKSVEKKPTTKGVQKTTSKKVVTKTNIDKAAKAENKLKTKVIQKKRPKTAKKLAKKAKATRKFKKTPIIGDQDFLSVLPSDCLDEILIRLNESELDKLSTVSQAMYNASVYARPRSLKSEYQHLIISQLDIYRIGVIVAAPYLDDWFIGRKLLLDRSAPLDSTFKKTHGFADKNLYGLYEDSKLQLSAISPIHRKIMEHLLPLLTRFDLKSYIFDAVGINEHFVEDFKVMESSSIELLSFERCAFDKALSSEGENRFLSLIVAAKPGRLVLNFPRKDDADTFDVKFIQKYANCVDNPKLLLKNEKNQTVTPDLIAALSRFKELEASSLLLEPLHVLDMILHRLESIESEAEWEVSVTGEITDALLATKDQTKYALLSDCFMKRGARIAADIHYSDDDGALKAFVNFGERSVFRHGLR